MRDWAAAGGKTAKDWDARFRNWLRKAGELRPRASSGYTGPPGVSRMDLWAQSAQNLNQRMSPGPSMFAIEGGA
ncbi:hypothetical protein [Flaviflexus ciconiae]|nr:hypothetical protein [Flaviflexus ciconiae]